MKQLDTVKAFTLLELQDKFKNAKSIEFDNNQNCFWVEDVGFTSWPILDPITSPSLSIDAIMKYFVDIDHYSSCVSIASDYTDKPAVARVCFAGDEENIGSAIIECILKSAGKWDD